jgi:hypothetical protein
MNKALTLELNSLIFINHFELTISFRKSDSNINSDNKISFSRSYKINAKKKGETSFDVPPFFLAKT